MTDINTSLTITANDKVSGPVEKMRAALGQFERTAARIGGITSFQTLGNNIMSAHGALEKVSSEASRLAFKFAALGTASFYAFNKLLLQPAIEVERLTTQFETIQGSSEKAKQAMGWIEQFAIDSPFNLKQTSDAFITLRKMGLDPTTGTLRAIGEAATATGASLEEVTDAVASAVRGRTMALGRFGITAKSNKQTGQVQYTYADKAGALYNSEIIDANNRILNAKTISNMLLLQSGGAMEKFNRTFEGSMDNITDVWEVFQRRVAEAGMFKVLSGYMRELAQWFTENLQNGTVDRWARAVSDALVSVFDWFRKNGPTILNYISIIASEVDDLVIAIGGWKVALLLVSGFMSAKFIVSIVSAVSVISKLTLATEAATVATGGLEAASVAMALTNPFTAAIMGAAALTMGLNLLYAKNEKFRNFADNIDRAVGLAPEKSVILKAQEERARAAAASSAGGGEASNDAVANLGIPQDPLLHPRGIRFGGILAKSEVHLIIDGPARVSGVQSDPNMLVNVTTLGTLGVSH